jgi:hypothetical protein
LPRTVSPTTQTAPFALSSRVMKRPPGTIFHLRTVRMSSVLPAMGADASAAGRNHPMAVLHLGDGGEVKAELGAGPERPAASAARSRQACPDCCARRRDQDHVLAEAVEPAIDEMRASPADTSAMTALIPMTIRGWSAWTAPC